MFGANIIQTLVIFKKKGTNYEEESFNECSFDAVVGWRFCKR